MVTTSTTTTTTTTTTPTTTTAAATTTAATATTVTIIYEEHSNQTRVGSSVETEWVQKTRAPNFRPGPPEFSDLTLDRPKVSIG